MISTRNSSFCSGRNQRYGPAPQADARAHDPVGLLESGFAFEKGLGIVVEGEAGGLAVAGEAVALLVEELAGEGSACVAIDAEIDGGFGEGAVKIADGEPGGGGEEGEANRDEPVVAGFQAVSHSGAIVSGG